VVVLVEALLGKTDFLAVQEAVVDKMELPLAERVLLGKEIPAEMVATMQMVGNAVAVAAVQALSAQLELQASTAFRAVMV
jgi:hypothetical protein